MEIFALVSRAGIPLKAARAGRSVILFGKSDNKSLLKRMNVGARHHTPCSLMDMRRSLLVLLLGLSSLGQGRAETIRDTDPATRLETWIAQHDGVSLRLTQISPDQAVAFFLARGFPEEWARHYAQACVFMTVVRNTGETPIEYDLRTWTFRASDGEPRKLKVKEDWLKEWDRRGIDRRARIGFEWSQFPTRQNFQPGDWNQGMTTYALPRNVSFDVQFNWRREGRSYSGQLSGARCALPDALR